MDRDRAGVANQRDVLVKPFAQRQTVRQVGEIVLARQGRQRQPPRGVVDRPAIARVQALQAPHHEGEHHRRGGDMQRIAAHHTLDGDGQHRQDHARHGDQRPQADAHRDARAVAHDQANDQHVDLLVRQRDRARAEQAEHEGEGEEGRRHPRFDHPRLPQRQVGLAAHLASIPPDGQPRHRDRGAGEQQRQQDAVVGHLDRQRAADHEADGHDDRGHERLEQAANQLDLDRLRLSSWLHARSSGCADRPHPGRSHRWSP